MANDYSMRMLSVVDGALREGIRRTPIKLGLTLKADPPSQCSITLPVDCPEDPVTLDRGRLFMVNAPCGVDTMFFVKTIKADYNKMQLTLTGDDVFSLLGQLVVFGKVTPTTINNAYKRPKDSRRCWAHDAIDYALTHCEYAPNGDGIGQLRFEFDAANSDYSDTKQGWSFNGQTVQDILRNVTDCCDRSQWHLRYDFARCTVVLSLKRRETDVSCELRASRNMKSLQVTEDTKNMVNRLYVVGKNDANIKSAKTFDRTDSRGHFVHTYNSAYLQDVESVRLFGIHAAQESNTSMSADEDLIDWGMDYIHNRSKPSTSVTCSAVELSRMTGAEFDRLAPGKIVRICMPERGYIYQERIAQCAYSDLAADPTDCSLTIADEVQTMKDIIYKTGGGGGGKKKDNDTNSDLCDLNNKANATKLTVDGITSASGSTTLLRRQAQWELIDIGGTLARVLVAKN